MSTMQDEFNQLVLRLKAQRDELRVKSHLLKLDLQDEWAATERKWEQLNQKLQRAEKEGAEGESRNWGCRTVTWRGNQGCLRAGQQAAQRVMPG